MVSRPSRPTFSTMVFQYSLCRVVLMVTPQSTASELYEAFQYSLCRVVLMVTLWNQILWPTIKSFSTRSVESF